MLYHRSSGDPMLNDPALLPKREIVCLATEDGLNLRAWYFRAAQSDRPTVVFFAWQCRRYRQSPALREIPDRSRLWVAGARVSRLWRQSRHTERAGLDRGWTCAFAVPQSPGDSGFPDRALRRVARHRRCGAACGRASGAGDDPALALHLDRRSRGASAALYSGAMAGAG